MMTTQYNKIAVIILAAGLGTRMKSNKAKVLHTILGKPMLLYVVESAKTVAGRNIVVVVGNQAERVREVVRGATPARFAYQAKQLGTGHAVLCALPEVPADCDQVLILCGDVPLITARTLEQMLVDHCEAGRDITVLTVSLEDPTGYGRILLNDRGQICSIIEEADASEAQKQIKMINTGIYCVKKELLGSALTDIVATAYTAGRRTGVFMGSDDREFWGVNNLQDLAKVEMMMRQRAGINS
jgi:UDP-N-acetylglucosamine diphosphorylase/glucosamine-1-phosphate N-acetyltransferase